MWTKKNEEEWNRIIKHELDTYHENLEEYYEEGCREEQKHRVSYQRYLLKLAISFIEQENEESRDRLDDM